MRKVVGLLVVSVLVAVTLGPPALANDGMGYKQYFFPNHGNVNVALSMESAGGFGMIDQAWGKFRVTDWNPENIDRIYIQAVTMWVRRNNGTVEVLEALTGGPANNRAAPINYTWTGNQAEQIVWETLHTGCLHPDKEPGGIKDGNDVWVRAIYKIYWHDGTNTGLRSDKSNEVTFTSYSQCN